MPYQVSLPAFSGPMDLLLQVILRQEVEIYDIAISRITDEYLAHMEQIDDPDLELLTEFLVIAATLIHLKVRRMLPDKPPADPDEEIEDLSERDLLLARLVEGSTFRHASHKLRSLIDSASRSHPRCVGVTEERWLNAVPPLLVGVTPDDVRAACLRAVLSAPAPAPQVDVTHITPISITVGDAVAELVAGMTSQRRITFRRLTEGIDDRLGLVVRFLALLELVKQGLVDVEQATTFGDIVVSWTGEESGGSDGVSVAVDAYDG